MALVFAVMHLHTTFNFHSFCKFLLLFFFFKFKPGIHKSTEWSTIPACPSLVCFFDRGDTGGTVSLNILCPMFVYVLFHICLEANFVDSKECGSLMTCVQNN